MSTNDHFRRVDELFRGCVGLDRREREGWLDARCGGDAALKEDVLALVDEDARTDGLLDQPAVPEGQGPPRPAAAARAHPRQIGRYRVVRKVGEGGMGIVYEAEQDSPKRQVAIKLITAGVSDPGILRRFQHEAQVLGRLQHPGIAQIFEAGSYDAGTGAQPFLAMEFIRGKPLHRHVVINDLDTRERVELIIAICDAVQHAHLRGVIHRDLKPGNILVDDAGQPKILDFGVARATDADIQTTTIRTTVGQLVGTVPYMSPEQAAGDPDDLDTRSDVYALGVLLYETLTGRLPYAVKDKLVHEAVRVIREEEPAPLSSVDRVLRGDLDTIAGKTLEKDKTRRYQSAHALASDLRHYLADEPIDARPPSAWYQFSKFAKRNRAIVASGAVIVGLLVIGVLVTSSLLAQTMRARAAEAREYTRAQESLQRAEQVSTFLGEMFQLERLFDVPHASVARDRRITAEEILDKGTERIRSELSGQPDVQAMLLETIGLAYMSLSLFDEARDLLEQALRIRTGLYGETHPEIASSLHGLGRLRSLMGDYAKSEQLLRQALAIRRRRLGPDDPALTATMAELSDVLREQRFYTEAESLQREVVNVLRQRNGNQHPTVAGALSHLGLTLFRRGDYEAAERLHKEALDMNKRLLPPADPAIATSMANLASVLLEWGRAGEAEGYLEKALALNRAHYGDVHPRVAMTLNDLGFMHRELEDYDRAEQHFRRSLDMHRELFGAEHPEVARGLDNLARVLRRQGHMDEAEQMHRDALAMRRRLLDPRHPSIANSLTNLARVLDKQGRVQEAETFQRESLEIYRAMDALDPDLPTVLHNLALTLRDQGRLEEAVPLFEESVELNRQMRGPTDGRVATDLSLLARSLVTLGAFERAEPALLELYEIRRVLSGDDDGRTMDVRERIVELYEAWGRPEDAEAWR